MQDIYSQVTKHIVEAIEAGADNFKMPWHRGSGDMPCNANTQNHYTGVNVVSLWVAEQRCGYGSNLWATYKQWQDLGAYVIKGQKGSPVVFYKECQRQAEEGEEETYRVARASWVFNADQVKNYFPAPMPNKSLVEIVEEAESFAKATNADIRHAGNRACYIPSQDYIRMPSRELFTGTETCTATEGYYATLLHELTHWTGHNKRLDRDMKNKFGDEAYAMEELVAELGAAYLCSSLSITNSPRPDHAAYIANWLKVLKEDTKAIFTTASKASKAVDYLVGLPLPS